MRPGLTLSSARQHKPVRLQSFHVLDATQTLALMLELTLVRIFGNTDWDVTLETPELASTTYPSWCQEAFMLILQTAEALASAMLAVAARWQDVRSGASGEHAGSGCAARYSKAQLKATLAMMGCKTRHAHKVRRPVPQLRFSSSQYLACLMIA